MNQVRSDEHQRSASNCVFPEIAFHRPLEKRILGGFGWSFHRISELSSGTPTSTCVFLSISSLVFPKSGHITPRLYLFPNLDFS